MYNDLKNEKIIVEIVNLVDKIEDFENDNPLNGLYLLGFHNQSYVLKNKKEEPKHE